MDKPSSFGRNAVMGDDVSTVVGLYCMWKKNEILSALLSANVWKVCGSSALLVRRSNEDCSWGVLSI